MPYKVPRSKVAGYDFPAAVDAHAKELRAWTDHMMLVVAGKAEQYPGPTAPQEVDRAIRRDGAGADVQFVPDFEIVDDGPAPEAVLRAKKDALTRAVTAAEQTASVGVLPMGKRRLLGLHYTDAKSVPEKERTDEQNDAIAQYQAVMAKLEAINRLGAEMHAAIEDLTEADVDGWTLTPFQT